MSSSCCINIPLPEQVCYIPCTFCNILLAVSVPYTSLFENVTVRCGRCTNLWSVNMAAALQSWQHLQRQGSSSYPSQDQKVQVGSSSKWNNNISNYPTNEEINIHTHRVPEKRQRVPSAYNQFIKEEIRRIKANNPDITHRDAFSSAAKNWAHFPHIHFGLMRENNTNQTKLDEGPDKHLMTTAALLNK